ncbi:MAG: phosphoribosylglycinamide formyltransferase [Tissierellia bacterium]|nr:phosphoribosylglycinamide formyltransferase [Tissierellia bacterium]
MSLKRLAVFVSGSGTNLGALIHSQKIGEMPGSIHLVISDQPDCYGLVRAAKVGIPTKLISLKADDPDPYPELINLLYTESIDWIILAGFMRVLPASFVHSFRGRILNLHPALLPKYGGVGMYGDHVHRAVLEAGDAISGATVHLVDEGCDTGQILAQDRVNVYHGDDVDSLRARISPMERALLVKTVNYYIEGAMNE